MSDLFQSGIGLHPIPEKQELRFDWYNAFAIERLGMPPRWRWFKIEVKNHGKPSTFTSLTGAVCDAKFERGKRKGNDNWKLRDQSTEAELAIREGELTAFKLDWQSKSGKCFHCWGTGEVLKSWSVKEGTKYRGCLKCGGTGIPVRAEAVA